MNYRQKQKIIGIKKAMDTCKTAPELESVSQNVVKYLLKGVSPSIVEELREHYVSRKERLLDEGATGDPTEEQRKAYREELKKRAVHADDKFLHMLEEGKPGKQG